MKKSKAGFIVKRIYPTVASYIRNPESIRTPSTKMFLDSQPPNVLDMLKKEAKRFPRINPTMDPIDKSFISTDNPKIFLISPRGMGMGHRTPAFYSCPHCRGRLFWNTPFCGWCGRPVGQDVNIEDGSPESFLNFIDYIYPQSSKPPLSPILSALTRPDKIEDKIDPNELKMIIKQIDEYIPSTAYSRG